MEEITYLAGADTFSTSLPVSEPVETATPPHLGVHLVQAQPSTMITVTLPIPQQTDVSELHLEHHVVPISGLTIASAGVVNGLFKAVTSPQATHSAHGPIDRLVQELLISYTKFTREEDYKLKSEEWHAMSDAERLKVLRIVRRAHKSTTKDEQQFLSFFDNEQAPNALKKLSKEARSALEGICLSVFNRLSPQAKSQFHDFSVEQLQELLDEERQTLFSVAYAKVSEMGTTSEKNQFDLLKLNPKFSSEPFLKVLQQTLNKYLNTKEKILILASLKSRFATIQIAPGDISSLIHKIESQLKLGALPSNELDLLHTHLGILRRYEQALENRSVDMSKIMQQVGYKNLRNLTLEKGEQKAAKQLVEYSRKERQNLISQACLSEQLNCWKLLQEQFPPKERFGRFLSELYQNSIQPALQEQLTDLRALEAVIANEKQQIDPAVIDKARQAAALFQQEGSVKGMLLKGVSLPLLAFFIALSRPSLSAIVRRLIPYVPRRECQQVDQERVASFFNLTKQEQQHLIDIAKTEKNEKMQTLLLHYPDKLQASAIQTLVEFTLHTLDSLSPQQLLLQSPTAFDALEKNLQTRVKEIVRRNCKETLLSSKQIVEAFNKLPEEKRRELEYLSVNEYFALSSEAQDDILFTVAHSTAYKLYSDTDPERIARTAGMKVESYLKLSLSDQEKVRLSNAMQKKEPSFEHTSEWCLSQYQSLHKISNHKLKNILQLYSTRSAQGILTANQLATLEEPKIWQVVETVKRRYPDFCFKFSQVKKLQQANFLKLASLFNTVEPNWHEENSHHKAILQLLEKEESILEGKLAKTERRLRHIVKHQLPNLQVEKEKTALLIKETTEEIATLQSLQEALSTLGTKEKPSSIAKKKHALASLETNLLGLEAEISALQAKIQKLEKRKDSYREMLSSLVGRPSPHAEMKELIQNAVSKYVQIERNAFKRALESRSLSPSEYREKFSARKQYFEVICTIFKARQKPFDENLQNQIRDAFIKACEQESQS